MMGNWDPQFQTQDAGMPGPPKGRFVVRQAVTASDIAAAFDLRRRIFRADAAEDRDGFDDFCQHFIIRRRGSDAVAGYFRMILCADGDAVAQSYSAQSYDLSALQPIRQPLLELGRFCVDAAEADADVLRLAWAEVTRQVDLHKAAVLFGCTSFSGTDPAAFADSFALLHARHRAPERWHINQRAPEVAGFAALPPMQDAARALRGLPTLLRSYLALGGWVSDHAVIDRDLGTMHVFTGLEIAAIPPARQRLLRAAATQR